MEGQGGGQTQGVADQKKVFRLAFLKSALKRCHGKGGDSYWSVA
jgi:hypothetical protein